MSKKGRPADAAAKERPTWEVFQPEAAAEPVPKEPTNEELRRGLSPKPKLPSRQEIAAREEATKNQLFDGVLSGLVALFAMIVMAQVAAGGVPFSDSGWRIYGTVDMILVMLLSLGAAFVAFAVMWRFVAPAVRKRLAGLGPVGRRIVSWSVGLAAGGLAAWIMMLDRRVWVPSSVVMNLSTLVGVAVVFVVIPVWLIVRAVIWALGGGRPKAGVRKRADRLR